LAAEGLGGGEAVEGAAVMVGSVGVGGLDGGAVADGTAGA